MVKRTEECSRGAGYGEPVPPERNWLERLFEAILSFLFYALITLALISIFVILILGLIAEDIWNWLTDGPTKQKDGRRA